MALLYVSKSPAIGPARCEKYPQSILINYALVLPAIYSLLVPLLLYSFLLKMLCLKCNFAVDQANEKSFIRCDGCNRAIHIGCSDLTTAELKCFELRQSSKRRVKYICIDCEQGVHQIPKLIAMINELKDEIREMKNKSMRGGEHCVSAVDSQSLEEVVSEVEERSRRSCNIIIYGSSEQGNSKAEQAKLDAGLVGDIVKEMDLPPTDHKPVRLGRFDGTRQSRSRPIRIRLSTPEAVRGAVRMVKELKKNEKFSALSISFDRTPRQVAYYKSVKLELRTRIDAGETNLKIKYKSGVPTIVSSEN